MKRKAFREVCARQLEADGGYPNAEEPAADRKKARLREELLK